MKRFTVVAALAAAAFVPPTQSIADPDAPSGAPVGWGGACITAGTPVSTGSCRFLASADTVGSGGFAGPGATITLSHKEKVADCVGGRWQHSVKTVVDESVTGPNYLGAMDSYVAGVVYTLTVAGPGWAVAGGPSTPAAKAPAEPADAVRDMTGGKVEGAACTTA